MSKKNKPQAPVKLVTLNQNLGKLPPQATDLEEVIISGLIAESKAVVDVIEFLRPEHFYKQDYAQIYEAIVDLFKESSPIDVRTIANKLKQTGNLELVGGQIKIWELASMASSAANIEYHSRVVVEMSMKRELIKIASEIIQDCYEDTSDVFKVTATAQYRIDQITGDNIKGAPVANKIIYEQAVTKMVSNKNNTGITGVPSGYIGIDKNIGGWQNSDLVIIAARPGMGKTAFVVSALRNAAIDHKKPVAIFSLEMASVQLMNRMISSESEVHLEKIIKGTIDELDYERVINKSGRLSSAPIFIDDTPNLTILELRAKARRLKAEQNIELIVVDYLQLMKGEGGNREQEISSISRGLKVIAKELNIPVIALSQLSRGVESRGGDKMPMLSDLRESGSIEQDADIVAFIYRAEYYKITQYADGTPTHGKMDFIIAKHRNGSTDTIRLKFVGKYTKVMNDDVDEYPEGYVRPLKPLTSPIQVRDVTTSENENDDLPF